MKRIFATVLVIVLVMVLLSSCAIEAGADQNYGATTAAANNTAATANNTAQAGGGAGFGSWIFIIILIVVFIVLIIVPNKRREKKYKEMIDTVKVGSNVKTIGGIYGKIVAIKEDLVTIETGPEKAKIVFSKSAIATIEKMDVEAEQGSKGLK